MLPAFLNFLAMFLLAGIFLRWLETVVLPSDSPLAKALMYAH